MSDKDKNNGKLTKVLGKNNNRDDILSLLSCDLDIRNAIKGIVREVIHQENLVISSDREDISINGEMQSANSEFLLNEPEDSKKQKRTQIMNLRKELEDRKNENNSLKEEVRQRKTQIISLQKELDDKKEENNRLKDEVRHIRTQIISSQKELEDRKNENNELKEENQKLVSDYNKIAGKYKNIKNELEAARKCVSEFKNNYGVLDEKYQLYLQLGDDIHRKLERVLSPNGRIAENAEIFLGYGVQEDNIAVLWDVIAAGYQNLENAGKLNDMTEIFNYLFEVHKIISFKKITYTMPEIGEEFDERKHSRASGSDATGEIVKVILPGFKIGNNIQKKALVYVK